METVKHDKENLVPAVRKIAGGAGKHAAANKVCCFQAFDARSWPFLSSLPVYAQLAQDKVAVNSVQLWKRSTDTRDASMADAGEQKRKAQGSR